MSRHSAMPSAEVDVLAARRRRRCSAEEKQRMVQETYQPAMTLSQVARAYGVSPSLLFQWRELSGTGSLQAIEADEAVVPASEYQEAQRRIKELQRLLGKKTQVEQLPRPALWLSGNGSGYIRCLSSW